MGEKLNEQGERSRMSETESLKETKGRRRLSRAVTLPYELDCSVPDCPDYVAFLGWDERASPVWKAQKSKARTHGFRRLDTFLTSKFNPAEKTEKSNYRTPGFILLETIPESHALYTERVRRTSKLGTKRLAHISSRRLKKICKNSWRRISLYFLFVRTLPYVRSWKWASGSLRLRQMKMINLENSRAPWPVYRSTKDLEPDQQLFKLSKFFRVATCSYTAYALALLQLFSLGIELGHGDALLVL